MNTPYIIVSFDGGGYRGLFAAHLIKRIQEEWAIDWRSHASLLAGTSTGAILAAGLACGIPASRLAEFFETHGKAIFTRRRLSRLDPRALFTSRYSSTRLAHALNGVFGDQTLGEVSVPLVLPAVDIGNGCVHVFKSKYHRTFVRDPSIRLADAILASCSAPTYFDPIIVGGTYQLVDGGLWANNPCLVAAIDAHYRLEVPFEDMRILSIGTGKSKVFYPLSAVKWRDRLLSHCQGWGFATRWQHRKLIDLILNLQADTAYNSLCLLMGESPLQSTRVLRLTFESDEPLAMDSARHGSDWVAKADHCFTHNALRIADFLGTERSPRSESER